MVQLASIAPTGATARLGAVLLLLSSFAGSIRGEGLPPLFHGFALVHDLLAERQVELGELRLRRSSPDRAEVEILSPSRLWKLTPVFLLSRGGMTSSRVEGGRRTRFDVPLEAPRAPETGRVPLSLPGTCTAVASSLSALPLKLSAVHVSAPAVHATSATELVVRVNVVSDAAMMDLVALSTFLDERPHLAPRAIAYLAGPPGSLQLELSTPARGIPRKGATPNRLELLDLRKRLLDLGLRRPLASSRESDDGVRLVEISGELAGDSPWEELFGRLLLLPGLERVDELTWTISPEGRPVIRGLLVLRP